MALRQNSREAGEGGDRAELRDGRYRARKRRERVVGIVVAMRRLTRARQRER